MIKQLSTEINGLTLRGTAHIPDGATGQQPTVLMFHGFSSNRDEAFNSFVYMSRLLNKNGIAAIAFDYGYHGESDGDFIDFTFSQELEESRALVAFVQTLDFVDTQRLSLLGMSLGSVAASMTAGQLPNEIKSLCMWSPAAVFVDEIANKHVLQGKSTDTVSQTGYLDFNSLKLGPAFFADLQNIQIYEEAAKYKGSVTIIHGDADNIAPLSYSKKYQSVYQQPTNLVVVPGASHAWNSVAVKETLLKETLGFFKETLLGQK
ncbi:alpha/beta hydrolase [Levilactobacillus wangkuiensis]|uniref:alpha/beta hydrolase n=1 Tax=Levilactobacillus wangkuiensis TaxID=2799566 RepID=UPI001940C015|nr:alpha/beta hydrolase [Levilactobacillus wangkuiensis]